MKTRSRRAVERVASSGRGTGRSTNCCSPIALAGIALASALPMAGLAGAQARVDPAIYAAWQAMRQLDCARCHGRDYTGSVGVSLLESARTRSRDEFVRLVLDGNLARGMPPYRSVALATENAEGMYAYLAGRANGTIPAGTLTRD